MTKLTVTLHKKNLPGGALEAVLQLDGSLDQSGRSTLEEHTSHAIECAPSRVVIEIARLRHIDPTGLDLLHLAVNRLRERHIEALLENIPPKPETVRLVSREINGVTHLSLAGHLDMRGVAVVEKEFRNFFERDGFRVLIDFSTTDLLSSLGIRLLLTAVKSAAARKGRVLFLNPSPAVSSALETAGLGHFIARGADSDIARGMNP